MIIFPVGIGMWVVQVASAAAMGAVVRAVGPVPGARVDGWALLGDGDGCGGVEGELGVHG